jgi:S-adenosylmethionine hydrolase
VCHSSRSFASPSFRRRTSLPQRHANGLLVGEILTIDRFGNALTNLMSAGLAARVAAGDRHRVLVGQEVVSVVRTC